MTERTIVAPAGVELRGTVDGRGAEILSAEALAFLAALHRRFDPTRRELLERRVARRQRFAAGELPDFLPETADVREREWSVAPAPADLLDRRVEITGPTDRKMVINALNSGANVFMADFEDANAPTWHNMLEGQVNLADAVAHRIDFTQPDGREYRLGDEPATLLVRPRGWHLVERHLEVDGEPVSGSLFDFGLYFFHNARALLELGSGPYFYLAKLESHREARLWNDVFEFAQDRLEVPRGSVRATVLIETILAAFEMEEILYELRDHSAGLNAGRWDYIFSAIKYFGHREDFLLPDRAEVTMAVPFMRAYAQLLVKSCHRRGAHAIGGMAAFIPSRRDPAVNATALAKVREDKLREAGDGFDGTWVAHPDLVPVARAVFDEALGERPNQLERQRDDVDPSAADLLDFTIEGEAVTEAGLRGNVGVCVRYIAAWLGGVGAVAIRNLMEDAATAEIARSQVWQWVRQSTPLADGQHVTAALVRRIADEELTAIREAVDAGTLAAGRYEQARELFEQVALSDQFVDFLTLPAYKHID